MMSIPTDSQEEKVAGEISEQEHLTHILVRKSRTQGTSQSHSGGAPSTDNFLIYSFHKHLTCT